MFKAAGLRAALLAMATATILTAGCNKAPEYQGEGPKMEFVRIPAGSFHMGSPATEEGRDDNEGPVHEVRITKPFYMGKYEVTQAQWEAVMGTTVRQQRDKAGIPWHLKGEGPQHPMYYVSWEEAVEFCKRLGRKFRLPTEAEWEYACRSGSQTRFCYGDDPNYSELDQYAWYYGKSDNETHPVGQKKPNAWGLYDMHGNVREWCSDLYPLRGGYENARSVDPTGITSDGMGHVARGGSWTDKPVDCRSACRNFAFWFDTTGFRIVFTGKVRGDSEVLEIALPEKTAKAPAAVEQDRDNRPEDGWLISGVVRDESGKSIDGLVMCMLPSFSLLRTYAEGRFEAYRFPDSSEEVTPQHRFLARHMQRNLVAVAQIDEGTENLDVNLAPGVILTGEVVGSDRKGVKGAKIITRLKESDWQELLIPVVLEADDEGKFEMRALPQGYEYLLGARSMGYRIGRTDVRPEDVRDNRVDGVSIVLPRGHLSVSGVVVDPNGQPVPDIWVYCSGKGQAGINCHTDKDGRFKADGIFEGKVKITAAIRFRGYGRWDLWGSIDVEAGATNVKVVLDNKGMSPPKGRTCFPGETNVWVDGAVMPLSKVVRGQTAGKLGRAVPGALFGHVERIEEHEGAFECRDILLDSGNQISVVDSHCFMLECSKWIAAQDLRAGLRLKTVTGTVGIKSVTIRATPYIGKVYNLKISNSDRYAVGKDGVVARDY